MLGQLPRWRAAREIIDWDNPGRSLLDDPRYQKKPLSEKTMKRMLEDWRNSAVHWRRYIFSFWG
jgi:hypothetical protein